MNKRPFIVAGTSAILLAKLERWQHSAADEVSAVEVTGDPREDRAPIIPEIPA